MFELKDEQLPKKEANSSIIQQLRPRGEWLGSGRAMRALMTKTFCDDDGDEFGDEEMMSSISDLGLT